MSMAGPVNGQTIDSGQKLISWKSIARYFDCDERTAKRWERERGLPVHRAPGGKRSTVFAYSIELDSWLRTGLDEHGRSFPSARREDSHHDESVHLAEFGREQSNHAKHAALRTRPTEPLRWPKLHAAVAVTILLSATLLFAWHQKQSLQKRSDIVSSSTGSRYIPIAGAEDLYLRGRYFWSLRTADSLTKSIDSYTKAINLDPSYAEAYAGLAESYVLLPEFAHYDLALAFTRAKQAANRSIELNPNLAAAHRAKAFALFFGDWDIPGSDSEFQRALEIDPNSAETHQWYASTLLNRLEGPECLKQIDEALRLSPSSAAIATEAAFMHEEFGSDPNASIQRLRELEVTQPTLVTPSFFLMTIDFAKGDFPPYIVELHHIASITHHRDDIAMADAATRGWARGGKLGLLRAILAVQQQAFERGTESGFRLGQTYILLNSPKEALPYFKASLEENFILLITMENCDWSRRLSNDSAYQGLFEQIHHRMHSPPKAYPGVVPASFRLPL